MPQKQFYDYNSRGPVVFCGSMARKREKERERRGGSAVQLGAIKMAGCPQMGVPAQARAGHGSGSVSVLVSVPGSGSGPQRHANCCCLSSCLSLFLLLPIHFRWCPYAGCCCCCYCCCRPTTRTRQYF